MDKEIKGIAGDAHHDIVFGLPQYETIAFKDLHQKNRDGSRKFLEVLLMGYLPDDMLKTIIDDESWDSEKMRISITLNGHVITHAILEEMCSEFSGRMCAQRLQNVKFDDFQAAVLQKASALSQKVFDDFHNKTYEMQQAMEQITASSTAMVEQQWESERIKNADKHKLRGDIIEILDTVAGGCENVNKRADEIIRLLLKGDA